MEMSARTLLLFLATLYTTSASNASKPSSSTTRSPPSSSSLSLPPECPKGSAVYERNRACFWVIDSKMKWAEGDRACGRQGGKLASIADEFENNFVFDAVKRSNLSAPTVWLGKVAKVDATGAYEWHDGTVGRFRQAFKGGEDACLSLWADMEKAEGSWHEWSCSYAQGYAALCKRTFKRQEIRSNGGAAPSNPLDDFYYARRCCYGGECGKKCASNERCIPDDVDCVWKTCTGEKGYGWCLPMP